MMGPRQRGNFADAAPICTTQQEYPGCRCMLVALSPVCGLLQSAKHLFLAAKKAAGAVLAAPSRSLVPALHPVARIHRQVRAAPGAVRFAVVAQAVLVEACS